MREGRRICAELRGWRTAEALVGHPGALDEDALDDRLPAEGALVPKLLLPLVDALLVEGDRPAAEQRPPPWDCARAAALRRRHRRLRRDHRLEAPLALRRRRVGEEGLPALDVHLRPVVRPRVVERAVLGVLGDLFEAHQAHVGVAGGLGGARRALAPHDAQPPDAPAAPGPAGGRRAARRRRLCTVRTQPSWHCGRRRRRGEVLHLASRNFLHTAAPRPLGEGARP